MKTAYITTTKCLLRFAGACLALAPLFIQAGLHPLGVLIVANEQSVDSLDLARYYQARHGMPGRNIARISVDPVYTISAADFSNQIQTVVLDYIAAAGLGSQIDTILFSSDIPYRVSFGDARENALTSAMFYGTHNYAWNDPPLTSATFHDYYQAERRFSHDAPPSAGRYYLSTMLTTSNLNLTRQVVDRAHLAQGTHPDGSVVMHHTPDPRTLQWRQFDNLAFLSRYQTGQATVYREGYLSAPETNVIGWMIGQHTPAAAHVRDSTYLPGAIVEHVTSFGGILFEPSGQMSILRWLEAGAIGSYGTIIEPYALTNKFPEPRMHYWYGRGFSFAESLYMAVQAPYQGIAVGDPLCAPFAHPATVSFESHGQGETVSGVIPVAVRAVSTDVKRPLDRIDLYANGLFLSTLTNMAPTAGNEVTVQLNGTERTYGVAPGDTLFDVAQGVASRINLPPPLPFAASASGDRVEIKLETTGPNDATNLCRIATAQGTGAELTIGAHAVFSNMLPSAVYAYKAINLAGTCAAGDTLRIVVTNLLDQPVTNEYTCVSGGSSGYHMLGQLAAQLNSDPALQDDEGCRLRMSSFLGDAQLVARQQGHKGLALSATLTLETAPGSTLVLQASNGPFNSNAEELKARGQFFITCGSTNLAVAHALDTTGWPDGPLHLQALAREGTGVGTWSMGEIYLDIRNSTLACHLDVPVHGANIPTGSTITVTASASSSAPVTNLALFAGDRLVAETNAAPASFAVQADDFGPGLLTLQALARDDEGNSAWSEITTIRIYRDSDGDGLPDWWEYAHFGNATGTLPTDDPDDDGADNLAEYIAGTDPLDAASAFLAGLTPDIDSTNLLVLAWASTTQRFYQVFHRTTLTTNAAWEAAHPVPFRGQPGTTRWTNDPAPGQDRTYYRVRARVP